MDLFKKKMSVLDFKATEFGLHSLKAGGATSAANAGVPAGPPREFKGPRANSCRLY